MDGSPAARAALLARHPRGGGALRRASAEEIDLVRRHVGLGRQIRAMESRRDAIASQLRAAIGDDRGIGFDGGRALWSRFERREIAWDALRAERPEIAEVVEQYRRPRPADRLDVRVDDAPEEVDRG